MATCRCHLQPGIYIIIFSFLSLVAYDTEGLQKSDRLQNTKNYYLFDMHKTTHTSNDKTLHKTLMYKRTKAMTTD